MCQLARWLTQPGDITSTRPPSLPVPLPSRLVVSRFSSQRSSSSACQSCPCQPTSPNRRVRSTSVGCRWSASCWWDRPGTPSCPFHSDQRIRQVAAPRSVPWHRVPRVERICMTHLAANADSAPPSPEVCVPWAVLVNVELRRYIAPSENHLNGLEWNTSHDVGTTSLGPGVGL